MVQCMEAWFLADREKLSAFYGDCFRARALPAGRDVEQILKKEIYDALAQATRTCKKGIYHKTAHAFEILQQIDPEKVRAASAHADRFFVILLREARGA